MAAGGHLGFLLFFTSELKKNIGSIKMTPGLGNCRCFTEIWPKMNIKYVRFWEIERITHFRPPSSQILSYINIFNINRKLLTQTLTWI